ncbi:MAG: Rap1a/Tai family immunity protein [Hyphomicrobiaceae bacterium]|nr:Rap1a/Tai family immunity protein [Hyphomicrobiaceae bacterium]
MSACAAAAVAIGLGLSLPATAQGFKPDANIAKGSAWLKICTSQRRSDEALCNGFIMGLEETQFLSEYRPLYCPPKSFTVEDQKEVIVKFLKENPGRHSESFARLAADAMRKSFPCRP